MLKISKMGNNFLPYQLELTWMYKMSSKILKSDIEIQIEVLFNVPLFRMVVAINKGEE